MSFFHLNCEVFSWKIRKILILEKFENIWRVFLKKKRFHPLKAIFNKNGGRKICQWHPLVLFYSCSKDIEDIPADIWLLEELGLELKLLVVCWLLRDVFELALNLGEGKLLFISFNFMMSSWGEVGERLLWGAVGTVTATWLAECCLLWKMPGFELVTDLWLSNCWSPGYPRGLRHLCAGLLTVFSELGFGRTSLQGREMGFEVCCSTKSAKDSEINRLIKWSQLKSLQISKPKNSFER